MFRFRQPPVVTERPRIDSPEPAVLGSRLPGHGFPRYAANEGDEAGHHWPFAAEILRYRIEVALVAQRLGHPNRS